MSISALTLLAEHLQPFRNGIAMSPDWCDRQAMTDALASIRQRYKPKVRFLNHARILELVADYMHNGQVTRPDDVFTLCAGAAWLDQQGRGILADPKLRRNLLVLAATLNGRKRRLKAFRSLLYAYWSFPLYDETTPADAVAGWQELRAWLKLRHTEINHHPARKPIWFKAIAPHVYLLEENPCARFAKSLLRGNLDELQHAIDCLSIPSGSWLKTAALMAQIEEATQRPDESFRALLPGLLKLATGEADLRVTTETSRQVIARLIMRYARMNEQLAHTELFTQALEKIGNPWRQQAAWDAHVCDEGGHACSLSREMVSAWLKDSLIGEFFADSGQEESRSQLWQRYSVFVQAMSVASSWPDRNDPSLLLRMGKFLVIVPHHRDKMIDAYPWQIALARDGKNILDKESVDGETIRRVLDKRKPGLRLEQKNNAECDRILRGLLFATAA